MKDQINFKCYKSVFALPSILIERYLPTVCGYYLKVILYLFYCNTDPLPQEEEICKALSLSKNDVHEALEFWRKESILISADQMNEAILQPQTSIKPENESNKVVKIISNRAPVLSAGEIAQRIDSSQPLKFVFEEAERLFGRPLTTMEQRVILSMHDWMNLPTDVILMIFEYCRSIDKISIRQIEKEAAKWSDLGITTHELAEEHLSRLNLFNEQQRIVRECCGITSRNLTANEKKFIEIWFNEYGFDISMIKIAFEKTCDNIGKISFAYMNKILKQWHEAGITTPEGAYSERKPSPEKGKRSKASYDLDALDRIGLEIPEI